MPQADYIEGAKGLSEGDRPSEKITVLFPDRGDEAIEAQEAEESADGEGHDKEAEDKVVRLDFRRESARRSSESAGASESPLELSGEDRAKLEIFSRLIEDGMVMVTLDTRFDGVDVPPKFRGLAELRLNFSHFFELDDFEYTPSGLRASLSFSGERYFCKVPWPAVFMLYSHETSEVFFFEPS